MTNQKDINRKLFMILREIRDVNKNIENLINELIKNRKENIIDDIIFEIEEPTKEKQTINE